MLSRLRSIVPRDQLARSLAAGGAQALSVRAVGMGLTFITHILLARLLGWAEYGTFIYVYTWTALLGLTAKLGYDRAAIRFGPQYLAAGDVAAFASLAHHSFVFSAAIGVAVAMALCAAVVALGSLISDAVRTCFLAGAWTIPLLALHHVHLGFAQAQKKVIQATAPEQLLRQAMLGLLVLAFYGMKGHTPTAAVTMCLHGAAVVLLLAMERAGFNSTLPAAGRQRPRAPSRREWHVYAVQMTAISNAGMWTVQMDILLVGAMLGPAAAGIYSVASRIAGFVPWVSLSATTVFAPVIAELAARGDYSKLQGYTTLVARPVAVLSGLLAVTIWILHPWILGFFGNEFREAAVPLAVLLLGQTLQDLFGPVSAILNLSGLQRTTLKIVLLGLCAGFALNILLIERVGLVGASLATTLVTLGNAILLWLTARAALKIDTAVFPSLRPLP